MYCKDKNFDDNTCIVQESDTKQEFSAKENETQYIESNVKNSDANDATIQIVEGHSPKTDKRNLLAEQFELPRVNPIVFLPKSGLRIEDFQLSQDTYSEIEVVEVASAYEIRKPKREEFIRTHSDQNSHFVVGVIKEKTGMNEKLWLATEKIMKACPEEAITINLRVTINRLGQVFLWPLNLGGSNLWNQSALQAAEQAKTNWVRLISNREEGRYQVMVAKGELPDPVWPEYDLWEMIQLGFGDRIIADINHPYLQQLRGEI